MELDKKLCYRAVLSRDRRFDGKFFTAVLTTGIYCRPICPATHLFDPHSGNRWVDRSLHRNTGTRRTRCLSRRRPRPAPGPEDPSTPSFRPGVVETGGTLASLAGVRRLFPLDAGDPAP